MKQKLTGTNARMQVDVKVCISNSKQLHQGQMTHGL